MIFIESRGLNVELDANLLLFSTCPFIIILSAYINNASNQYERRMNDMPFFGFGRRDLFFRDNFRRRRFFPFEIELERRRRFEIEIERRRRRFF